jgi:hypothetical protein
VVAFAHAVIDAGADLVIGHGPHVLRALELYQGKLIAYSLGNFLTYARFNIDGPSGLSLAIKVRIDAGTGNVLDAALVPFRLAGEGIPVPDPEKKAVRLIRDLTRKDIAGPGIVIADDGKVTAEEAQKAEREQRRRPDPEGQRNAHDEPLFGMRVLPFLLYTIVEPPLLPVGIVTTKW